MGQVGFRKRKLQSGGGSIKCIHFSQKIILTLIRVFLDSFFSTSKDRRVDLKITYQLRFRSRGALKVLSNEEVLPLIKLNTRSGRSIISLNKLFYLRR